MMGATPPVYLLISTDVRPTRGRVIRIDEESRIARDVMCLGVRS
jgi:hypothetical protein